MSKLQLVLVVSRQGDGLSCRGLASKTCELSGSLFALPLRTNTDSAGGLFSMDPPGGES